GLLTALGANHDWNKTVIVVDDDVDINDFDDVWWAYLTRGRADTRAMVLSDVPGFYRDPQRDHWGRLGIDATAPFGRKQEFVRKRITGADAIDLRADVADGDLRVSRLANWTARSGVPAHGGTRI